MMSVVAGIGPTIRRFGLYLASLFRATCKLECFNNYSQLKFFWAPGLSISDEAPLAGGEKTSNIDTKPSLVSAS